MIAQDSVFGGLYLIVKLLAKSLAALLLVGHGFKQFGPCFLQIGQVHQASRACTLRRTSSRL
jgi:hypothetical protein